MLTSLRLAPPPPAACRADHVHMKKNANEHRGRSTSPIANRNLVEIACLSPKPPPPPPPPTPPPLSEKASTLVYVYVDTLPWLVLWFLCVSRAPSRSQLLCQHQNANCTLACDVTHCCSKNSGQFRSKSHLLKTY